MIHTYELGSPGPHNHSSKLFSNNNREIEKTWKRDKSRETKNSKNSNRTELDKGRNKLNLEKTKNV